MHSNRSPELTQVRIRGFEKRGGGPKNKCCTQARFQLLKLDGVAFRVTRTPARHFEEAKEDSTYLEDLKVMCSMKAVTRGLGVWGSG